jgi:hypothetical protein
VQENAKTARIGCLSWRGIADPVSAALAPGRPWRFLNLPLRMIWVWLTYQFSRRRANRASTWQPNLSVDGRGTRRESFEPRHHGDLEATSKGCTCTESCGHPSLSAMPGAGTM